MSSKKQTVSLSTPAVIHIITDKASSFVSATLTRRNEPSGLESNLCDWQTQINAAGVACVVVGRGPRVANRRVMELCETLLRLNQAIPQVETATLLKERIVSGVEVDEDEPGMEFENDPFWQHIKAIAGGER